MARPTPSFHHFIGQRRVMRHLQRLIDGAKALGKPCPPLLLTAPSGFGKTALATALAAEFGSELFPLFAGDDIRAMHICAMLQALRFGDIFFIDEAHSLCPDAQQVLYVALDQYKAPTTHKKGLQRDRFVSVASFTLVLATNEPGRLKKSLRSRLERVEFDPYTIPELKAIAQRIAGYEGIELTPQAARKLAEVAQGSPRTVCHRLQTLQYHYPYVTRLGQEHIDNLLDSEGIDHNGLWPYQRHYLAVLAGSRHGSCSLERFAVTLGCDTLYIRQEIEPYLVEKGFVEFQSHRGRVITQKGRALVAHFSVHNDEMYSEEDKVC